MKNRFRLLVGFMLVSFGVMAQQISGTVTSAADGSALPGVSVSVKGTTTGTITSVDGKYSINAGSSATLVFSFVGYTAQEVVVGNRTTLNVSLAEDSKSLEEVVVTALGIKRESRKLGYSTESVKVDEIAQNRTTNVMTSLQGKIAGLDISAPASGAGSSTRIRLRGQSAFAGANNAPLIVINGLPMDQGNRGAEGGNTMDRGDNMLQFNPDDVESMTVLKGATAAALYGSRAANGAIIITTKTGNRNQSLGVEYSMNYANEEVLDFTDFQYEYGQGTYGVRPTSQGTAVATGQLGWGEKLDGRPTVQFDGVERPYSAVLTNRLKDFYRNGSSLNNTVALSGGGANGSFRASFSNQDALGIMPNNDYHRKIFNLGVNQKINNKLSLQVNLNYTNEVNNNPPHVGQQGIGGQNFLMRMANNVPLNVFEEKAVNDLGLETMTNGFQGTIVNPYFTMGRLIVQDKRDRYLGTATLRYDITDWLYLQGRVNMDQSMNFGETKTPTGIGTSTPFNQAGTGYNGSYNVNTGAGRQMNMDFLLGGNKEFGDFSVDLSVGGNIFTANSRNFNQTVTDFYARDLFSIDNGITKTQSFGISRSQINSLYAFSTIGYKNLVFLTLNGRQDWFSVLNPQNNSAFYPSAEASFVFSDVIKSKPGWFNYGKLRATYADVGSSNGINPFAGILTYGINQQTFNGYSLGSISNGNSPNPFLRPFTVSEKEVGFELRMLNNRLTVDVSAYDKQTRNQILNVSLSNTTGYGGTPLNLGSLQNRGIELLLDGTVIKKSNFSWRSSFNTAFNTTKVLALTTDTEGERFVAGNFSGGNEMIGQLIYQVGLPLNQLAARTYRRNEQGQVLLDNRGRLLPNQGDLVLFGSALPKFVGGWNNTFTYKNLSLLVHFDYKAGGKVLSSTALNTLRQGHSQASLEGRDGIVFDGVYAETGLPNTTRVAPQDFYADYRNAQIADPFIFKSDFVKLRNVTLAYDATRYVSSKVNFVKGLNLSFSCRNVFLLYKDIPDVDPEAFASSGDTRQGYEQTSLPTTRTYGVNLNVKF